METLTLPTQGKSNTIQLKLPLEIGIKIDPTDKVVTFKEVMEGVNLKKYLVRESTETRGRDGQTLWLRAGNRRLCHQAFLTERADGKDQGGMRQKQTVQHIA